MDSSLLLLKQKVSYLLENIALISFTKLYESQILSSTSEHVSACCLVAGVLKFSSSPQ